QHPQPTPFASTPHFTALSGAEILACKKAARRARRDRSCPFLFAGVAAGAAQTTARCPLPLDQGGSTTLYPLTQTSRTEQTQRVLVSLPRPDLWTRPGLHGYHGASLLRQISPGVAVPPAPGTCPTRGIHRTSWTRQQGQGREA